MSVPVVLPTKIFPAVPLDPAVPVQPVMVSVVAAVQLTALEFAKVSVWLPVPSAMVEFAVSASVPMVSEKPALVPLLNVPPPSEIAEPSATTPAAPNRSVPPEMVVAPV